MNSMIYESPLGAILLTTSDGHRLSGLKFVDAAAVPSSVAAGESVAVLEESVRWLDRFFAGKNPGCVPPLSLRGTEFQCRVWRELCSVDYGRTVTYGELARRVGCRSARAVGSALGRNPILLMIPCHRVVAAVGPGGYAAGLSRKLALMRLEGVEPVFPLKF
ncbi:MAG: methylated-DNA--[protein]-cysteine S-methyltransferase [Muribaculaceae bacterium]|nr:methylated-DNA--[protein]-cysteine S-methyltransferase [Muribaculaceae bacterium]MDE7111739.1 methylated-DNA--[protein]-cysteine S-methyltransferase [Muribaculaceae bacterium]